MDRPLILDGAMGTELERRRVATPAPLWSAAALRADPRMVARIHAEYAAAGADILVANTFRTNPRTLRAAGQLDQGDELCRLAVELARKCGESRIAYGGQSPNRSAFDPRLDSLLDAIDSRRRSLGVPRAARDAIIAASVGPAADCYRADQVPPTAELAADHRLFAEWLAAAKPDLLWIETIGTLREAAAAGRAAVEARLPFAISFILREDGRLLGGDRLAETLREIDSYQPLAVGVNCIPPHGFTALLPRLRELTTRPIAAYAHIGNDLPLPGWSYAESLSPREYADAAMSWLAAGASIVGGCCGTTPEHIAAIRSRLDS
ncbi:MAG: homocysteine S-methyltransferase family protein [Phycisphaerae bacterium]